MKKILLTMLSALLLVGCTQVNDAPHAEKTSTYNNEELGVFFQYPSNWEVVDSQVVQKLDRVDNKVFSEEEKFDHYAEKTSTYNNEEFGIFFQYPSNWEVVDRQVVQKLDRVDNKVFSEEEKFDHSVLLKTGDNESIFLNYKSLSFDEYESYKRPNELGDDERDGFLIEEITMANYPSKKYTEYSAIELAGISYIVEKNGKFLIFMTESGLTDEQKIGVEEILNSLEFK